MKRIQIFLCSTEDVRNFVNAVTKNKITGFFENDSENISANSLLGILHLNLSQPQVLKITEPRSLPYVSDFMQDLRVYGIPSFDRTIVA